MDAFFSSRHFRTGLLQAGAELAQFLQRNIPGHLRGNAIRLLREGTELCFRIAQVFLIAFGLFIKELNLPRRGVHCDVLLNARRRLEVRRTRAANCGSWDV